MTGHVGCGVAVVILSHDRKVVLGERIKGYGKGKWGLPGGSLETEETLEECAFREVEEETGIPRWKFRDIKQLFAVAHKLGKDWSWVTIYMHAILNNSHFSRGIDEGIVLQNVEPEKCAGWELVRYENVKVLSDSNKLFGGNDTQKAISRAMKLR